MVIKFLSSIIHKVDSAAKICYYCFASNTSIFVYKYFRSQPRMHIDR